MKSTYLVLLVGVGAVLYAVLNQQFPILEMSGYEGKLDLKIDAIRVEEGLELDKVLGRYTKPLPFVEFPVHQDDYAVRLRRFFQLKRWHYSSLNFEKYFCGFAIAHLSYAANIFIYVVDKETKQVYEYGKIDPLGIGVTMSKASIDGCTSSGSQVKVCYTQEGEVGPGWQIEIDAELISQPDSKKTMRFQGDFHIKESEQSLALVLPLDASKIAYTHKTAGSEAEGKVVVDGKVLNDLYGYGVVDWTKQLAKRPTLWKWVSLSCQATQGNGENKKIVRLGINFSMDEFDFEGVSQENSVWINGQIILLDRVVISAPSGKLAKQKMKWNIFAEANSNCAVEDLDCEHISLEFSPMGARRDELDLSPLLNSSFVQPFGTFSGVVKVKGHEAVAVTDAYGVVEDHFSLW